MDFKNIDIMVGIAALFSTVSLNSYGDNSSEKPLQSYRTKSNSKVYTVFTSLKNIIPQNLKGFKDYNEYADSLMMSNSSQIFLTEDVGNNFVIHMIPHYEAAIVTSKGILKYTQNTEVKNLAHRIVQAQEKKVEIMQRLLGSGELRGNYNKKFLFKMKEITMRLSKNTKVYDGQLNNSKYMTKYYLQNMIIHHEGAIRAAKEYLKLGKNKELIKMSHRIILIQDEEIKEMKEILKRANI